MKKLLAILLSAALLASILAVCAVSAGAKTWEDDQTLNDDGDYVFDNAYGFVFTLASVDGSIGGEDNTFITNSTAYLSANPNWAISVFLKGTDVEGVYSVISVLPTPAATAGWDINTLWPADATACLIAHSAYSNPNGTNYQAKCAAMALAADTLIKLDGDKATVQNEDGTFAAGSTSDEETSTPAPEKVLKNIALGATYTTSALYQQGGADVEWGWDPEAPIAWPDEDGKSLTDGVTVGESAGYGDPAWAGFHPKTPDYIENGYSWIKVDLGSVQNIANVNLYVGTKLNPDNAGAGISAPQVVEFLASEDGENFTSIANVTPKEEPTEEVEKVSAGTDINARYVMVRMQNTGWMFVSEIEVEAYVESETEDDDSSATSPAGDASSMIVFAVIAFVALAGSAVVVKTRK